MNPTEYQTIIAKLDQMSTQLAYVTARQRATEEMFSELTPVAKAALSTLIERFADAEQKGYFDFGRALMGVGGRVVEGFSPQDVQQLGDAIVSILQSVRVFTQPDMLRVAADASAAMNEGDNIKPLGMFGMVRATKDEDVQKGMALMFEMLRRVGKGVNAMAEKHEATEDRKAKLAALLGPKRGSKALGIERALPPAAAKKVAATKAKDAAPPAPAASCSTPKPAVQGAVIDGIAYSADGHLMDANVWTRALGETLAQVQGLALTDAHWTVLDAARADFATTKQSPNIRRLTQVTGMSTKDLYTLFPKAPGRTIAKVAGLPKPAGCL
jgi:tRNA 2-thiouridine synthesizing protein E